MTNAHDDTDPRIGEANRTDREREDERDRSPDEVDPSGSGNRYASLDLENGDVVIYDPDNHRAWVQSDDATEAMDAR